MAPTAEELSGGNRLQVILGAINISDVSLEPYVRPDQRRVLPPPIHSYIELRDLLVELDTQLFSAMPAKVIDNGFEFNPVSGCWLPVGLKHDKDGYSRVHDEFRKSWVMGHRYLWERLVGPLPEGVVLDHLCRVRGCFWPKHLEPIGQPHNTRRGARDRKPQGSLWYE